MGYYLQSYGRGYITREGDKYQYHEGDKAVGTYDTIDELVEALAPAKEEAVKDQPQDGEQDTNSDTTSTDTTSSDVAPAPRKKSTSRNASATKQ